MTQLKITGNVNPVVGEVETYSIDDVLYKSMLQQNDASQNYTPNVFDNEIKWSVWVLERGSWRKTKENDKTGKTVTYTFHQKSLTRKGIKMMCKVNEEKAIVDITPQRASQGKIIKVDLLDANYSKPTRPFAYNDWIVARVHCVDMERFPLQVTLWEDDGGKKLQDTTNVKIETKKATVENGKADVKFYLDPSHAWLGNARLSPGDTSEGANHEYYITAEIFEKVSKRAYSFNTDVPNPDYKPPTQKQPTPAEQKGPSQKETKGINTNDTKVHDYHEQKIAVSTTISTNPVAERINSVMTVDVDSKWWEKKEEKNVCECEARVRAFMRMLRVKEGTKGEIGYTTLFTNVQFSDMSKHPQKVMKSSNGLKSSAAGAYQIMSDTWKNLTGYYQDTNKEWHYTEKIDYAKKYNITSFDQESQDKFCVVIMKHNYLSDRANSFYNPIFWKDDAKTLHDIEREIKAKEWRKRFKGQQGDIIQFVIDNDIKKAELIASLAWASLPDSPYGQQSSDYTFADVNIIYEGYLKEELIAPSSELHLKTGFLKDFGYQCCSNQSTLKIDSCDKCNQSHYDIAKPEHWVHQKPHECWKASIEILAKYGLKNNSGYPQNRIIMADQLGNKLIPKDIHKAIDYIDSQLRTGKPVVVGLDDNLRKETYNSHKATEHFFVIVGKGCEEGKLFYRFFDVGAHSRELGTGKNSKLFLLDNGLLQGKSAGGSHNYTVTEIRKNN